MTVSEQFLLTHNILVLMADEIGWVVTSNERLT